MKHAAMNSCVYDSYLRFPGVVAARLSDSIVDIERFVVGVILFGGGSPVLTIVNAKDRKSVEKRVEDEMFFGILI
ncbi:hypothetical protein E2P81_ATG04668 [Venturia nashicola]|nr:hypothetical protein E2P81_ATG04668 [Venturia nashicola]